MPIALARFLMQFMTISHSPCETRLQPPISGARSDETCGANAAAGAAACHSAFAYDMHDGPESFKIRLADTCHRVRFIFG